MFQDVLFSTKGQEHHNQEGDGRGKKPSPLGIGPGVQSSAAPIQPLHQCDTTDPGCMNEAGVLG